MVLLETPVLEEAHLPGLFLEVRRQVLAEFLDTLFPGERSPVDTSFLKCDLYERVAYALLPEIQPDTDRALALVDAGLDESFGEALVALQAVLGKSRDGLGRNIAFEAFIRQFANQLRLPVFATGEEVHRFLASLKRRRKTIFPLVGEKIVYFFVDWLHAA